MLSCDLYELLRLGTYMKLKGTTRKIKISFGRMHLVNESAKNKFLDIPSIRGFNAFSISDGEIKAATNFECVMDDWGNFSNSKTEKAIKNKAKTKVKLSKLIKHLEGHNLMYFDNIHYDEEEPKAKRYFIEYLTNTIKSLKVRKLIVSDKPSVIYDMENNSKAGTLSVSCMRPSADYFCKHSATFFDAVGAKIVYALDTENRLLGRALIWENCINAKGKKFTFLDRVYGSEDVHQMFVSWAKEQGYYYKEEQTFENYTLLSPDGKGIKLNKYKYKHNIKADINKLTPYMDTLDNMDKDFLYSFKSDNFYKLKQCNSRIGRAATCASCGKIVIGDNRREAHKRYFCSNCICETEEGYYALKVNCHFTYRKRYVLKSQSVFLCLTKKYAYYRDKHIVKIKNKYYLKEELHKCIDCKEIALNKGERCESCTNLKTLGHGTY